MLRLSEKNEHNSPAAFLSTVFVASVNNRVGRLSLRQMPSFAQNALAPFASSALLVVYLMGTFLADFCRKLCRCLMDTEMSAVPIYHVDGSTPPVLRERNDLAPGGLSWRTVLLVWQLLVWSSCLNKEGVRATWLAPLLPSNYGSNTLETDDLRFLAFATVSPSCGENGENFLRSPRPTTAISPYIGSCSSLSKQARYFRQEADGINQQEQQQQRATVTVIAAFLPTLRHRRPLPSRGRRIPAAPYGRPQKLTKSLRLPDRVGSTFFVARAKTSGSVKKNAEKNNGEKICQDRTREK